MIAGLLVMVLIAYSAWGIRHISLRKKRGKAKCEGCPFKDAGTCC